MALERKRQWRENLHSFLSFSDVYERESRTNVNVVLDRLNSEECPESFLKDPAVC